MQGVIEQNNRSGIWDNSEINYTSKMGNDTDVTLAYYDNGNIKVMTQHGFKFRQSLTTPSDNLTYDHFINSNKLRGVISGF
jgi:hypothetical protein